MKTYVFTTSVILLFYFLGTLNACVTKRSLMKATPENTQFLPIQSINGSYTNTTNSDTTTTLWTSLYETVSFKEDTAKQVTKKATIQLIVGEKSLVVLAKEENQVVGQIEVKGKIKGDYFITKRNLFLIPIPFLFFRQRERRIALCVTDSNQLQVNERIIEFGWVFMAAGYDVVRVSEFDIIK